MDKKIKFGVGDEVQHITEGKGIIAVVNKGKNFVIVDSNGGRYCWKLSNISFIPPFTEEELIAIKEAYPEACGLSFANEEILRKMERSLGFDPDSREGYEYLGLSLMHEENAVLNENQIVITDKSVKDIAIWTKGEPLLKYNDQTELKLYAWQPDGHGELSAFVMAASEEEATTAIFNQIGKEEGEMDGFGTVYYKLTVLKRGQVVFNDNQ
jgi:hypothetical protein